MTSTGSGEQGTAGNSPGKSDRGPADALQSAKAFAVERRNSITKLVATNSRASVMGLADLFEVSPETIRRDLSALESQRVLQRVHGGAIRLSAEEVPIQDRIPLRREEKERIARAAVTELPRSGAILIEGGDTLVHLAAALPRGRKLIVVTNACYIAEMLADTPAFTVLMVGGRVRRTTHACVDNWALESLRGLNVDVGFFGTNGISTSRGLTTPDPAEAAAKREMLFAAQRRVLLADHTKVGAVSLCKYGEVSDIDVLISDVGLSQELAEEIRGTGPEVVRA